MTDRFIRRNYTFCIVMGIIAATGGVIMAYITNDSGLWSTIGGMLSFLGLIFIVYVSAKR